MSNQIFTLSPQISRLNQALKQGESGALKFFWRKVAEETTPLVESIAGDDHFSLVTFLWRAVEISQVYIISLLTNPTTFPMTRLGDTDLWYMTCKVRNDVRATYQFYEEPLSQTTESNNDPLSRWATYKPDPLNPRIFAFYTEQEDPIGVKLTRSILEMPAVEPQPLIKEQEGVPKGEVKIVDFPSEILGNQRRTWVYTPPGYTVQTNQTYGLIVLLDGWAYANLVPTFTILDNLLAEGLIPPMVAILPDSLDNEERLREMIFHKPFNEFLIAELIPWAKRHYQVTSEPRQTIVGGSSAGGLAAAYAGFEHPEIIGNVIAQSGAFGFAFPGEDEPEWLARQFGEKERQPVNFYIDAGILEVNSLRDLGNRPNLLEATRNLYDVLCAKGYQVTYAELAGGHDYISWQGSLATGLQTLIGSQKRYNSI
jgi:enterochelin esterase family protein